MDHKLATVKAAAIDGRAHTPFRRLTELEKLHSALRKEASAIQDAIIADRRATRNEAAIEFYASMKCVADAYNDIQPVEALAAEYSVSNGKDAPQNREPVGIVYIEPQDHTLFYSVLCPVSSAIAAGNCVVILLERTLQGSSALLRQILTSAMEPDSFAIVERSALAELPASSTVFALQNSDEQLPRSNQLLSVPSRCVAVVDRTANLDLAASELVAARFAFGGRSPYAPDVVLVNEFAHQRFLQAVVQECIKQSRNDTSYTDEKTGNAPKGKTDHVSEAVATFRRNEPNLRVVVQESEYAVVELMSRKSLLKTQSKAAVLCIHSIRSLDDAIDLISTQLSASCNAAYHFGTPETGKYLCQFVLSTASFVNHVPRELLLGPVGPQHHPLNLSNRYPSSFFSVSRPQYAIPTAGGRIFSAALSHAPGTDARRLVEEAAKELKVVARGSGKGVGFFEQGFLINFSLFVTLTLTTSVAGGYALYTRWRR